VEVALSDVTNNDGKATKFLTLHGFLAFAQHSCVMPPDEREPPPPYNFKAVYRRVPP